MPPVGAVGRVRSLVRTCNGIGISAVAGNARCGASSGSSGLLSDEAGQICPVLITKYQPDGHSLPLSGGSC